MAKTESAWQELAGGTAAALAAGFGAYDHFVSSGALDGFREMKVWDAGLISDPVYMAASVGLAMFGVGGYLAKKAREYFA